MREFARHAASAFTFALPFVILGAAWETVAHLKVFPPKLFPPLEVIATTFVDLLQNGILWSHIKGTLFRLAAGFALAAAAGVLIGILMGRYALVEDTLVPIVTAGYPLPGLAYAPLFVLWFGLGDFPAILLVAVASSFAVIINTWKGVKGVKPLWIRAAKCMGAPERKLFRLVILPAALPHILIGLRLGLAQAWRILVAVEMLMSVDRGLGWMIFGAQQFLNTDVMLSSIVVIGLIGISLEKFVFQRIERATVVRWGMMTA